MVFRIYTDKIRLVNDKEEAVAQIDFPEVQKGVCEIAHIYGERSAQGKEIAYQMMEMAVKEIRDSNRKVIPACAFARSWFSQHPELQDLIAGETTAEPAQTQQQSAQEDQIRQNSSDSNGKDHKVQVNISDKRRRGPVYDDDYEEESGRKRRRRGGNADDYAPAPTQSGGRGMKVLSRVLMIVCAICMAGIIYTVARNAFASLSSLRSGSVVSLAATAGFLIFCIVEFFWIFTKKKFYYQDRVIRIDNGRGLVGFIIVLIVAFLCMNSSIGLSSIRGLDLFISIIHNDVNTVLLLGIVGFLLTLARKLIGR